MCICVSGYRVGCSALKRSRGRDKGFQVWHQNNTRAVITEHRNIKGVISEVNVIQDIWLATALYIMVGSASVSKNTVPTLQDWHRINRDRGCSFRMFQQALCLGVWGQRGGLGQAFVPHKDELRPVQLAVAWRLVFLPGEVWERRLRIPAACLLSFTRGTRHLLKA